MRLVDTLAWIGWLIGSDTGRAVEPLLPRREAWLVPTIVPVEPSKWLAREEKAEQTIPPGVILISKRAC